MNGDTVGLEEFPAKGNSVPKEVFATAFFADSTRIAAKMAKALGFDEKARAYGDLHERIKAAFNEAYVKPDCRINGDTQAGYALALNMHLLPEAQRSAAMGNLLEAIERYKGHLSTGFHTAYRLMLELSRNGQHGEACRIINLRTPPSWGYMIEQGATTLWERWDGYVEGRGFHDTGMNSFNHYMFGAVGEWVWRNIAGINPDERFPAYKHFILRPRPGPGFTWARGAYDSIRGTIKSDWRIDGKTLHLAVTVPVNATATVYLETSGMEGVTESGKPLGAAKCSSVIGGEGEFLALRVESGTYVFDAPH